MNSPRLLSCLALLLAAGAAHARAAAPAAGPATGVIEVAPDGVWTWYNDERAIIHQGQLIAGYVTHDGRAAVSALNLATGARTHSGPLSSWREVDDHDNPSLSVLPDGRILAIYARHNTTKSFEFRTTVHGADITRWSEESTFADPASTVGFTYSHCYRLSDQATAGNGGRLYNFLRSTNFDPNLTWSDDNGRTWSPMLHLFKEGGRSDRPYLKMTGNGRDRLDFTITERHPRNYENSVYHGFFRYDAATGAAAFHRSDGTLVKTLAQISAGAPLDVRDFTRLYDGTRAVTGRGWTHDIAHDPRGHLAAVFSSRAADNDLRYHYARWDPRTSQWDARQIAFAGRYLYPAEADYTGGITIDPEDANTVFLSSNVDIATGATTASGQYELYRGVTRDEGRTWAWTQLTHDSPEKNLRPMVPRRPSGPPIVVWCRGRYDTYKNYATRVMALVPAAESK